MRTEEDEDIDYDFAELDELTHAYAVTVHRAQGSEWAAVVVVLTRVRLGRDVRDDGRPYDVESR